MDNDKPERGYRQNRELAIIVVLFSVLIFFRLDGILGALGLRQYYPSLVHFFIVVCVAGFWTFLALWNALRVELVIIFGIACTLFSIAFGSLFMSVFVLVVGGSKPSADWLPIGGLIISAAIWFYKPNFFAPLLVNILTCFILVWAIFAASFGSGYSLGTHFLESINFAAHHYYLIHLNTGSSDMPDEIHLYECNQLAFACRNIYETDSSQLSYNSSATLVANAALGSVDIFSGDVLLYRHAPS